MSTSQFTAATPGFTKNKVAIITGGSRGLGRNTALGLARRSGDDRGCHSQTKRGEP